MAWVAITRKGNEVLFDDQPKYNRIRDCWEEDTGISEIEYIDSEDCTSGYTSSEYMSRGIELPKGSIKKLIGKSLNWEDEPFELK